MSSPGKISRRSSSADTTSNVAFGSTLTGRYGVRRYRIRTRSMARLSSFTIDAMRRSVARSESSSAAGSSDTV